MGLNLTEANAVNRLIDYLTVGHDHTGQPLTRDQAILHLATLADAAYKRLSAGINGESALALLNERWHPEPTRFIQATPAEVAAAYAQTEPDAPISAGLTETRSLLLNTVQNRPPQTGEAEYALSMCGLARTSLEAIVTNEVALDPGIERMWESVVFLESAIRHLAFEANAAQAERDVANAVNLAPTDPAALAAATADLEAEFPDDEPAAAGHAPTMPADQLPTDCPECGRGLGAADGSICYDCALSAEVAAADPAASESDQGEETEIDPVFDPETPAHVRAYLEDWKQLPHLGVRPNVVSSFFADQTGYHELTRDQLTQLLDRLDYRAHEAEQLAKACRQYRSERDEARAMVRSLIGSMHLAGIQNDGIGAIIPISDELTPWLAGALDQHPAADTEASR